MMVLVMMLLAQAAAAPVAPDISPRPVINICASEPAAIPSFGQSCDAKAQAKRVTEIMRDHPKTNTVEITRYRTTGDGRTITNEQGKVVSVAAPCLLPTEENPKELQASLNEPAAVPDGKNVDRLPGTPQSITRCKTETFAMQFVSPTAAGR